MSKTNEHKPLVDGHSGNRVSSAVWPVSTRKVVATGKAAQRRRDWIMQERWWIILADRPVMRVLFLLNTLLIAIASLLVIILGLTIWYLLLLPLLLFVGLLLVPIFLASRRSAEAGQSALAALAHESKSSADAFSLSTRKGKSQPDTLTLKNQTDQLADTAPSTPVPVDQPLVRVLETYDLSSTPVEHFLTETGQHALVHASESKHWTYTSMETHTLGNRVLDDQNWQTSDLEMPEFLKSEQDE